MSGSGRGVAAGAAALLVPVPALALVLVLAGLLWPQRAAAHAELIGSVPSDGQSVDHPPDRLTLRFGEPVSPTLLRLIAPDGGTVELTAEAGGDPATVAAPLPPLTPGTHLVSWRVRSADGHPVAGSLAFEVGGRAGPGVRLPADGHAHHRRDHHPDVPGVLPLAHGVARAGVYAAALLSAGAALFLALLGTRPAAPVRLAGRLAVGAAAGGGLASAAAEAVRHRILFDAFPGPVGLAGEAGADVWIRLAGLALVAAAAWREARGEAGPGHPGRPPVTARRAGGAAGAVLVAVSFAATGHTVVPADLRVSALLAVHLLGAAFWVGCFPPLLAALRGAGRADAVGLLHAFSRLAVVLVPALAAAGAAVAWRLAGGWPDPAGGAWPDILLFKMAAVAAMLGLAALNRRRLVPALEAGVPGAAGRLRVSIAAEAVLALLVVGLTAALTGVHPPAPPAGRAGAASGFSEVRPAGALAVRLAVAPARAGANRYELSVTGADGAPRDVAAATLVLERPDLGAGPLTRPLERVGPGRFRLDGRELAVPGSWTVAVRLRVDDFELRTLRFTVPVGGPGPGDP